MLSKAGEAAHSCKHPQGRVRLDPHTDAGAAIKALARLARAKRRRGYQDRPV